jgi:hypothetical protein
MTTRRTFLVVGIAGGAALAAAWWLRGARERGATPIAYTALAELDAGAPAIIAAIVPALLDGAMPTSADARKAAITSTVDGVGVAIVNLPPAAQHELAQLFSLLAFAPARIALARVNAPWPEASTEAIAAFLDRWRTSGWDLQRSAYDALHQLVFAAWYGNPNSWPAIGYPGPPPLFT